MGPAQNVIKKEVIKKLIKLIKINKIIIDGILTNENDHDNELLNKLNNDLSISFNLLNLNLSNLKFGNSIELILKNKITHFYKFNFNGFSKNTTKGKEFWINEIYDVLLPLIIQDFKDGWI